VECSTPPRPRWSRERRAHDSSQLPRLRRPLHTLKGGARMAVSARWGELSHELESLITRIESGVANAD